MIAPARVAAYDILRAVSAGRADLPTAIAHARASPARRPRPRARRRDRDRRPALARGARPPDRRVRRSAPLDRLDPEVVDILRLSAYQLLHLTRVPAVGRRGRCGEPGADGRASGARAGSSTPCCAAISRSAGTLPLPPRPDGPGRPRRPRSTTSASRCRIRAGSPRAGSTGSGFDAAERWLRVQQRAGAADAARQPPADDAATSSPSALAGDGVEVARRRGSRPTRSIVDDGQPLRGRRRRRGLVRRAGRGVAARRAARRRRIPGRACSTPARRRAARRRRIAAAMRRRRPGRRVRRARPPHGAAAPDGRARRGADQRARSCRPTCCSRCPSRARSTASSSTRRAPASARCGATRTSAGGGARPICRRSPRRSSTMLAHAADVGRARRPARLRHLLERAGGERSGRRRVPRDARRLRAGRRAARAHPRLPAARRRRARPPADRARTCTASRRSSAPSSSAQRELGCQHDL